MRDEENIREVEALGPDLMGFIFYPKSPRFVSKVPEHLPSCKRVGVFVDEPAESLMQRVNAFGLDYIQLHGHESLDYCSLLKDKGLHLIKVFHIASAEDRSSVAAYEGLCDFFLFDTKTPAMGGSGRQFDWSILNGYEEKTPFLLSGGIGPESLDSLRIFNHPMLAGYDLNSRFESAPGVKDSSLLGPFIEELRKF